MLIQEMFALREAVRVLAVREAVRVVVQVVT